MAGILEDCGTNMNERIKELAIEAGMIVGEANGFDMTRLMPREVKFAELIVKECVGIYNKLDNGNQHLGTDDYLEALQKHFGVK